MKEINPYGTKCELGICCDCGVKIDESVMPPLCEIHMVGTTSVASEMIKLLNEEEGIEAVYKSPYL